MDIEKIKNYNTKVLAIFLTTLVAFAVIGLISFIIFLFTEVFHFPQNSSTYTPEGIQVEEPQQNSETGNDNQLHVSYSFPQLADTLNQLYIISVGHQTKYEIESSLNKRGKFLSSSSSESNNTYDYNTQATSVNLLIYDAKNAKLEKLFKQQILMGNYDTYYDKDDVIIVFEAVDKDSNKDGRITLDDETSLYFYSLRNKTMKLAKMEGETVLQYEFNIKTRNAMIRFGDDPNNRKDKNEIVSPGTLCRYDFDSDKLSKINDIQLNTELETIAGGKK